MAYGMDYGGFGSIVGAIAPPIERFECSSSPLLGNEPKGLHHTKCKFVLNEQRLSLRIPSYRGMVATNNCQYMRHCL